jgi:hypothetical protein
VVSSLGSVESFQMTSPSIEEERALTAWRAACTARDGFDIVELDYGDSGLWIEDSVIKRIVDTASEYSASDTAAEYSVFVRSDAPGFLARLASTIQLDIAAGGIHRFDFVGGQARSLSFENVRVYCYAIDHTGWSVPCTNFMIWAYPKNGFDTGAFDQNCTLPAIGLKMVNATFFTHERYKPSDSLIQSRKRGQKRMCI